MSRVLFLPSGREIRVPAGVTFLEAARLAGVELEAPCGGRGVCGACRVSLSPAPAPTGEEQRLLSRQELDAGCRLACICRVRGDVTCCVPAVSASPKPSGHWGRSLPAPDPLVPAKPGTLGIALDLGTTTLAGAAADLGIGRLLALATDSNPCGAFGADVMSRVEASLSGEAEALTVSLRKGVIGLVGRLATAAGGGQPRLVTVVGNPAMLGILLGADLSGLAAMPFTPPVRGGEILSGELVGLPSGADVAVLPVIGGFVGADTIGVALACGLDEGGPPVLAVDIGTNGELLLATGGRILACSCAAGPALEGGRISCGMRAVSGAVAGALLEDGELRLDVLGGGEPRGVCGSGLVDLAAAMLALGVLSEAGVLAGGRFQVGGRISLTQRDVRELQLAKGAMRAGAEILLREAGLPGWGEVAELLLAGAFGNYLRPASALRIGLIPPVGEGGEGIRRVGNAALEGALRALLSQLEWERALALARLIEHVELGAAPGFQALFADSMALAPR